MSYILNRISEPSTWAAIAALAGSLAAANHGTFAYAAGGVATVAGGLAAFMKDHGAPDK
jgi:hypothetical protein